MAAAVTTGPVVMVVSITEQRAYVYRNGKLIGATTVSTGRPGHPTPIGVFTVLQNQKEHRSTIYEGAPMPYMERLTWDGIALHAGGLPGYPARIVQEGQDEATILSLVATGLGVGWVLETARWHRPKSVAILSVVDMNLPQELSLAWRKDNRSPLLARFVADVLRFPDVRRVSRTWESASVDIM
jgi:L,D-transpeptidase catalytic domain/LysR substrate binding domain